MQESRIQTQVCLSLSVFVSIFSGNFTDSRPLAGPWAKSSARQDSRSWIQLGTGLLGRLGRSASGSGWPRASLGPGQAAGGPQVWGRAAAWPISKHIQSQPKGNPDSVSAGMPGAQALETLNIKCVGWLPSLVIKTLISYFTQDGQEGHGAVLRGFIAPLFTDEVAFLRKTSLSSGTHTALFIKLFPGRAGSGGREVSKSVEPISGLPAVSQAFFLLLQNASAFPGACRGPGLGPLTSAAMAAWELELALEMGTEKELQGRSGRRTGGRGEPSLSLQCHLLTMC